MTHRSRYSLCAGNFAEQSEFSPYALRARSATPTPLPAPAVRATGPVHVAEDHRGTESARAPSNAAKMIELRNYRSAKGLCFRCGERWGHDHVCPPTVKLHVIKELLDLFNLDVLSPSKDTELLRMEDTQQEQVWHLSVHAVSGTEAPICLQIHGWLQGREVLMLVDSRSSTYFVSQHLLPVMQGVQDMPKAIKVSVANGVELQCTQEVLDYQWYT